MSLKGFFSNNNSETIAVDEKAVKIKRLEDKIEALEKLVNKLTTRVEKITGSLDDGQ